MEIEGPYECIKCGTYVNFSNKCQHETILEETLCVGCCDDPETWKDMSWVSDSREKKWIMEVDQ